MIWGATRTLTLFLFLLRSSAFLALAAMRLEFSIRPKHLAFETRSEPGLFCVVGCWGRGGRPKNGGGDGWLGWEWKHSLTGGDVVRLGVLEGVEQGEGERGRWACVA